MTAKRKSLLLIGILCLALCLCFSACRDSEVTETTTQPDNGTEQMTYSIAVQSEGGVALEGLSVFVYADSNLTDMVAVDKTDAEGKMSFTHIPSDSYVAVLTDVPDGYVVEEVYELKEETTTIVLKTQLVEGDLSSAVYKLGGVMGDFTFTAADGAEYKLSELLQQKKAVVLNFWFMACNPCKQEFPYLQEAYEEYSDDVAVLAMNPVDTDNAEIPAFAEKLGLTFPIGVCDSNWGNAMRLTAYPTTVVIDRFGTVALLHIGSIPSAQLFKDIFAFFTAEDYVQTVVENVEDLATTEKPADAVENPVDVGGTLTFDLTLEPGQLHYVNIHKVTNVWLQVDNSDIYVEYGNDTYTASGGSVGLLISAPSTFEPAVLGFGNNGDETHTFTVNMSPLAGSIDNPYKFTIGEFTAKIAANNEVGIYYNYTATEDGYLTLECLGISPSYVNYDFFIQNLNTNAFRNLGTDGGKGESGNPSLTVAVNKGDGLRISIGTLPNEENLYPGGTLTMLSTFTAGEVEDVVALKKIDYAVTVTDENRDPVAGVKVNLSGTLGGKANMVTDEKGVAAMKLTEDVYTGFLVLPAGYTVNTTQFELTVESPFASLKLDTVQVQEKADYVVRVIDEAGKPVPGTIVAIGTSFGITDADGVYTVSLPVDSYTAVIGAPAGYVADAVSVPFPEGSTTLAITLRKAGSGDSNTNDPQPTQPQGSQPQETQPGETTPQFTIPSVTIPGATTPGATTPSVTVPGVTIPGATLPTEETTAPVVTTPTTAAYTVKVTDHTGMPMTGIMVVYSKNGVPVNITTVDNKGVATAVLDKDQYTVSLTSSSGAALSYDAASAVVSVSKPSVTIKVSAATNTATYSNEAYWGGSYTLSTGSTIIDFTNNNNYQAEHGYWMFLYYPAMSGKYTVTAGDNVEGAYFGSINFLNKSMDTSNADRSFTVTSRDSEFANNNQPIFVFGFKPLNGASSATITVARTADAPAELPVKIYEPAKEPEVFTMKESGKLTYVDITKDVKIKKKADGNYYITVGGKDKKLYVNLAMEAPYLTMSNMMGLSYSGSEWSAGSMGTGLKGLVQEGDVAVAIEDFTLCMHTYIKATDIKTGLYPLNDDLMYMFQQAGAYMRWWVKDHPNYLFGDVTVDPDSAWMFAVCYAS